MQMKYLFAAIVGGLVVAIGPKAFPKMMSKMMSEMQKSGHDPASM